MSLKLWEYEGKQVKIVFNDGTVYEGKAKDFDDEDDNASGYDSIHIDTGDMMFDADESEIKSIVEI